MLGKLSSFSKEKKYAVLATVIGAVLIASFVLPATVDAVTYKIVPSSLYKKSPNTFSYIDDMYYSNITTSQLVINGNESGGVSSPYEWQAMGGVIHVSIDSRGEYTCVTEPAIVDTEEGTATTFRLKFAGTNGNIIFGLIDATAPYSATASDRGGIYFKTVSGGNFSIISDDFSAQSSNSTTTLGAKHIPFNTDWHDYTIVTTPNDLIMVYYDGRLKATYDHEHFLNAGAQSPTVCIKAQTATTNSVDIDRIGISGFRQLNS